MLSFVFWHWPKPGVEEERYATALCRFLESLRENTEVVREATSFRLASPPGIAPPRSVYSDWYVVEDFTALGEMKAAAVSGNNKRPHDEIAAMMDGGAGSLYGLRAGSPGVVLSFRHTYWFSKPAGMTYAELDGLLQDGVARGAFALWQRQLVFGPTPEFCVTAGAPVTLPAQLAASHRALTPIEAA